MLLLASPLSRSLAVGGTLMFGTGCSEPTYEECDRALIECREACAPEDYSCRVECEAEADFCYEEAYYADERRAEQADAIADASVACVTVLACTLDSIDESTSEGDGDGDDEWSDPEPEPDPNDDWGEDWGEQQPIDELELGAAPLPDLPEE